ncbi:MAG: DUF1800 domain-containing protein [Pseudomonadota bacterium]
MRFTPELAEIRFGCGLSPTHAPPSSAEAILDGLLGPDVMAKRFDIDGFDAFRHRLIEGYDTRKAMLKARGTPDADRLRKAQNRVKQRARKTMFIWAGQDIQRRIQSETGFRERLVAFWADHFTAYGKAGILLRIAPTFIEDAIRPNIARRFSDLLFAAVTHPAMLHFLDQARAAGPNSRGNQGGRRKRGLNENLAREVMELHTLGVNGPYTQQDVRQLAELFTGLTYSRHDGFVYRPALAEPGPETILGREYGGQRNEFEAIGEVLEDLSVHPETHRHLARKLAVHFVSDEPDPALIDALAQQLTATGGDLVAAYDVLLHHPSSWHPELLNAKPPADFVASGLRALNAPPDLFDGMKEKTFRRLVTNPMGAMGQIWQRPAGPDGWPEEDANWITPHGVSTRIAWAMTAPGALKLDLPDPRVFVETALGPFAGDPVRFAAGAAESKPEAIGLVLASPAFQRR